MQQQTENKRDRLEERFREGLYDIEYSPEEESWARIAARLPKRQLLVGKRLNRIVAAIALFLVMGGGLLLMEHRKQAEEAIEMTKGESLRMQDSLINQRPSLQATIACITLVPEIISTETFSASSHTKGSTELPLTSIPVEADALTNTAMTLCLQECSSSLPARRSIRKWHIGLGGSRLGLAGMSIASVDDAGGSAGPSYDNYEPEKPDKEPITRADSRQESYTPIEPTKIKHLYPIGFGISASRRLNDRWSFRTGLTYNLLRSKWTYETNGITAQRQYLHLIGVPLSVSCRLTDWQRPYCYFNAGFLGEVNVAGKLRNQHGTNHIRIPGMLWSCSAKIGMAYPVIRFVSVYAEGGICYYFDYKGPIETIRSENQLNLSGQIGLQLNF